jgi:hypothetical protein
VVLLYVTAQPKSHKPWSQYSVIMCQPVCGRVWGPTLLSVPFPNMMFDLQYFLILFFATAGLVLPKLDPTTPANAGPRNGWPSA